MTGNSRCQGWTTMMGRGADGGCGTEEKPCPVSRTTPAAKTPVPVNSPEKLEPVRLGMDLYTQAMKALSERSPFDSDEVLATTVATLPSGLASLLTKRTDSRRKHKRPHSDTKSSRKGSTEKSKGSNIWFELEDYFKELTLQDIETLCRLSSSFGSSDSSNSCFTIPALGNAIRNNKKIENGHADHAPTAVVKEEAVCANIPSDVSKEDEAVCLNVPSAVAKEEEAMCVDIPVSDSEAIEVKEENNSESKRLKIDNGVRDSVAVVEQSPLPESASHSCSSVEWVLGSRNRVLLTTTRPTKKRKLLGETAGLERLIVAQPCEGSTSLCHVCSMGDTGDQLNQMVVCKSCNVVVHQKCYGVQGEINASWLCSWCKHNIDGKAGRASDSDRPCAFCPKPGGALKRFQRAGGGNDESVEFAHLFCSQWMPEVYIDDTRLMEPLLSLDGIKDVRGKLVCNLCKVKLGSCVRCSDGSCRTSFHPICAREARNKLEVWGKFGCDDIELRAFCAKHSGGVGTSVKNDQHHAVVGDSLATSNQPAVLSVNKIKKLKIGCKNGEKVTFHVGAADAKSNHSGETGSEEMVLKDLKAKLKSGLSDEQESSDVETLDRNLSEDVKTSYVLDLGLVLKKLIDRGKVSLEQVASDIGIPADSLASRLTDNHLGPDLYRKILKWLKDHAYMDSYQKDLRGKVSSLIPKTELGAADSSDAVAGRSLNTSDVVPVKSVPPRRRTVGNIRILKEDNVMSPWNEKLTGNDLSTIEGREKEHVNEDHDNSNKDPILDSTEKMMVETIEFEDPLKEPSPMSETDDICRPSTLLKAGSPCDVECNGPEATSSGRSSLLDMDQDIPSCSSVNTAIHFDGDVEPTRDSIVHPYIQKKLEEAQRCLMRGESCGLNGCKEHNFSTEQSSDADVCCNGKKIPDCFGEGEISNGVNLDDLHKAKETGVLDLFPDNEVEGEIIFLQQRLLGNAIERKHHTDQLLFNIVRTLPHEMDAVRKQRWDDVLVNQYIYELKEARKQGRKERRYKEAQAVLAAATAAAAASSRISSLRKDTVDESLLQENQMKVESSRVRGGITSQLVPRAKETNSSLAVPKATPDRYSDILQLTSGSTKENSRSCDICGRPESLLNHILVCSSCKVAVHLNCYRSVKESTGPWYCELCEESSLSKVSNAAVVNSWEKPCPNVECGLCGVSSGAFRKSSSGQWIHAYCAEWVFDSTFKRGQVYPVEGMERMPKGNDMCSVCLRRDGVCIKCNYGNCQSMFHPTCARSAGYYMYARSIGGGKMQHKAYCSKHSLEQRAKVETQKHAAEDLKIIKQHRVELEKLRLLCERIVKREKLKREMVLCNHDILASKRDSVALSMLVRRPYLSHEVSSESATTSLKGLADGSRSCSEAMQKSDDVTVDSAVSGKRCIRLPLSIDNDQKTDDSSTSQHLPTPKPSDRVSFSGKQIPIRAAMASRNFSHSGEKTLKSRKLHTETFEKELVMTSDQASMRNRRLPKGYIYVPIDRLANGKPVNRGSVEKEELDG